MCVRYKLLVLCVSDINWQSVMRVQYKLIKCHVCLGLWIRPSLVIVFDDLFHRAYIPWRPTASWLSSHYSRSERAGLQTSELPTAITYLEQVTIADKGASLHPHLSRNREGRWGTTDDFTVSFLHFSLFSATLWDLVNSRLVFWPLFLSALCSSPFHCALQDGFGQTWWTGDMSTPLMFASLYDGQEVFV